MYEITVPTPNPSPEGEGSIVVISILLTINTIHLLIFTVSKMSDKCQEVFSA